MTSDFDDTRTGRRPVSRAAISNIDDQSTGLPGLGTWPLVYLVVTGSLVLWVTLLLLLERFFA